MQTPRRRRSSGTSPSMRRRGQRPQRERRERKLATEARSVVAEEADELAGLDVSLVQPAREGGEVLARPSWHRRLLRSATDQRRPRGVWFILALPPPASANVLGARAPRYGSYTYPAEDDRRPRRRACTGGNIDEAEERCSRPPMDTEQFSPILGKGFYRRRAPPAILVVAIDRQMVRGLVAARRERSTGRTSGATRSSTKPAPDVPSDISCPGTAQWRMVADGSRRRT